MIIRFLTPGDVAEHEKVASQAFVFSSDIHDQKAALPCEKVLGAFADDDKTRAAIRRVWREEGYLMDPHTAVAEAVAADYRRETGDEAPLLIMDDPFTNLDGERLAGAKKVLSMLSEKYQILYLTCHESRAV